MPVQSGVARGDHREAVTRAGCKGNLLARRPVHPHRDQVVVVVEVGGSRQKSGARRRQASNRALEVRNAYDRALVENWAGCWCKHKSMNTRTMPNREMVTGLAVVGPVAYSRHETGEVTPSPDASARHAVHAACAQGRGR